MLIVWPAFTIHTSFSTTPGTKFMDMMENQNLIYRLDERFVHMNMILKEWGKVNDVIQPRFEKSDNSFLNIFLDLEN
jgi:hypothetical protein